LDGWWSEAYQPDYGWALGDRLEQPDDGAREAAQLYSVLEDDVVPVFYERDAAGLPRRWIARMRASMASLAPRFSSVRMLQEYVQRAYVPGAESYRRRAAEETTAACALARWSRHLELHWSQLRFGAVSRAGGNGRLSVSVEVFLGSIEADEVRVELYANRDGTSEALVQQMTRVEPIAGFNNAFIYRATVETARPADHFTPRVVPCHREARIPIELPLIAWQR
jgi:starch phosphorylase